MKISTSSVAFGAAIKTATQVINRAGAILLIPVFTRLMSPSDYGIVNLVSTFSAIIALLSLGFPVAQQVNYHRLKDTPENLGSYLFTINSTSALALFAAGIILLFTPWSESLVRLLLGTNEIRLFPHVAIGLGLGVCAAFSNLSSGYLNIRRQFHIQSILSIIGFALTAGLSWLLLAQTDLGATGRLLGMLLGAALPLAVSMYLYLQASHPVFSRDHLRDAWKIGWPAAINWGIFLIINQSDRIILSHFLDLDTVGFYTLAFTLASGMAVVVQSVAQSYSPLFMETATRQNGDVRSLEPTSWASVQVVLAIGLLASAWLPDLVHLLLPPSYSRTVTFLPCLTGALGLYILFNMLSLNYNFHKRTLYMPAFTVFAAALSAGLNLAFVPVFGEQAAAVNSLVTYILLTILVLFVTARVFKNIQFQIPKTLVMVALFSVLILANHFALRHPVLHFAIGAATTVFVLAFSHRLIKSMRALKKGHKA